MPKPEEITLRADSSEMPRASEWVEALCRRHGVPQEHVFRLLLCLDEAFANVLDHGGRTALAQPIRLRFEVDVEPDTRTASVTLSDAGAAYDPLAAEGNPLPQTLEEASTRGRGLQMMRATAPLLRYRRENGLNHLTFGTFWAEG